jgi:predicted CXXCH cytochrome family protein
MCFECHDDFLEKAAYKHTAVDDCSSCHKAHQADEKFLLIKNSQQLCFECHETKDLAQVKAHDKAALENCLKCHDPHAGKDKFLLKNGAIKTAKAEPPDPPK